MAPETSNLPSRGQKPALDMPVTPASYTAVARSLSTVPGSSWDGPSARAANHITIVQDTTQFRLAHVVEKHLSRRIRINTVGEILEGSGFRVQGLGYGVQ